MKKIVILVSLFVFVFAGFSFVINAFDNDKLNILIYGIDGDGEEETYRSDAIILANYNFNKQKIVITSIPRDSYVKITCRGNAYDKINHAYSYGKESCLNNTISQLFGINDVKNVVFNFDTIVELVDFFGLLEVVPNNSFCQIDAFTNNTYCFEKGKKVYIDGKQTLAYMRARKSLPNGDFDRMENQRQILKIIIKKFIQLSLIEKIKFYDYINNVVRTNVKLKDINVKKIINVKQIQLSEYTLKGKDYINEYYYYKLDAEYLEKIKKYYI